MLTHKGFKLRVYPTDTQIARMLSWQDPLRFLWNLALEQRLLGLARPRDERRFPTAFDQINELTELRAALPWLAEVPRDVCAQLLIELDQAWQRCFKKLCRAPRWKRKGKDLLSFTVSHHTKWHLSENSLHFPKLDNLHTIVHRSIEGNPKRCTVGRDGDQWFASIVCEIEIPDTAPRTEPTVALDRGITNIVADSDGNIVKNPKHLERALRRLAHAQRIVTRRKKGSKNREKAKVRVMRLHRKVRRQREHVLHGISLTYAKSHGTVIVENLKVQNMVHGHLARHIAGAGWGKLVQFLRYKTAWRGGQTVDEVARYSSQTCAVATCGHVDADSRHGERFCCTKCGHVDHADVNAAKVLKARFLARPRENLSGLPVEGSLKLGSRRNRKVVKLRVPRRSPRKLAH